MKSRFSLKRLSFYQSLAFAFAAVGLFVTPSAEAQVRIEMPDVQELRDSIRGDLGVIMDGTMFSSGSNMSISMSIENGVKKITATEDGIKTHIEEDNNGIVVRVTRRYGPEEMDILMEDHPGLYMAMKDFPSEVEDAEAVEVSVGVTKKYEAASPEDLKEKHPEIFKSYEKYSNGNSGGMQIFRGRFGEGMLMPEIRIDPGFRRGLAPAPTDLRVHEDDEEEEKKESKEEDKDT